MASEGERRGRQLRDSILGPATWSALRSATRTLLAAAEAEFALRRGDPAPDLSSAALGYARAVEAEVGALIFPAVRERLSGRPPDERRIVVNGTSLDLGGDVPGQSLGALRTLLEDEERVKDALLAAYPRAGDWIVGELPGLLKSLVPLRWPDAGRSDRFGPEKVARARERVLGIGRPGILARLVDVRENRPG